MSDDMNLKLQVFGLFKMGKSSREISNEIEEVSYAKCLKWKKELEDAERTKEVVTLLQAEDTLIKNVVNETKEQLEQLGAETEALEGELQSGTNKIETYKQLNENLNKTAIKLSTKISNLTPLLTDVGEVLVLTEALCKLQVAFFNKDTFNVNVFPGGENGISSDKVSTFKSLKRS